MGLIYRGAMLKVPRQNIFEWGYKSRQELKSYNVDQVLLGQ